MNPRMVLALALLWPLLTAAPLLRGQVYEKVFDFSEARQVSASLKGGAPTAPPVQGSDGNFYGTTFSGGAADLGTVFRLTPAGVFTTLAEFNGSNGAWPSASLARGSDGHFYGTTRLGGASNRGTIFRLTLAGELTTLVEFTGNGSVNKGAYPDSALTQGRDGNLYGASREGGTSDCGTLFKMTPSGVLTTLVEFTGQAAPNQGTGPSELEQGNDGNFYGMTRNGGANDRGTVFKVTPAGVLTTLVTFAGANGSGPEAGLLLGSDGQFYGTTGGGGANDRGTVFRMTAAGVLTTLVSLDFGSGYPPSSRLVQASDGHFYGSSFSPGLPRFGIPSEASIFRVTVAGSLTTLVSSSGGSFSALVEGSDGYLYCADSAGGRSGLGSIFKMTRSGEITGLVEFQGSGVAESGSRPNELVQGSDGNLYGATFAGGAQGGGTLFKLTPAGQFTTLASFDDSFGTKPQAALLSAPDGNFYGTTSRDGIESDGIFGSSYDSGSLFKASPDGTLTRLTLFTGSNGRSPAARLVPGGDGSFYGTTTEGGANGFGTVFKTTPAGVITTLVEFSYDGPVNKGRRPTAPLVRGNDGNFYGTTSEGGANYNGTVFRMTPAGVLTTLVEFSYNGPSNKGANPEGGLVQGSDGNFYGTTASGGASGNGTLFRMTPAGVLTTLVEFTFDGASNRGAAPVATLVQAGDGSFYGTTVRGGASDAGTLFKFTPGVGLTTIREFLGGADGTDPRAALVVAADGILYGTTSGGTTGDGTIFRLILPGAPSVLGAKHTLQGEGVAVIEAQVNARGSSTTVTLEYGTGGAFPNSVPVKVGLQGYQTTVAGTTLTGLTPATTYSYRFRAASSAGTTVSPVQSFSTLAEPLATALAATQVAGTSATFNGTVNARNFDTAVVFEWGTDGNAFPNIAAATPGTVTGNAAVPVSAAVAGLPEGGTVFYRLRATNAAGAVISGVRSFSTLTASTTALGGGDVGVTDVTFRATINTFGQTASVKFKYWADSAPGVIFETATQTVTSNGPTEVSARVTGLAANVAYSYRVSVELAGTETDGGVVAFTMQANVAPAAGNDLIFYAGSVTFNPLLNDTDANNVAPTAANAGLSVFQIVTPPQVAKGVVSIVGDGKFIGYTPQFSVLNDDSMTYRVTDPQGATADGAVRLVSFLKRAGGYGAVLSGSGRSGVISVEIGNTGAIRQGSVQWQGELYRLKGVFDSDGRVRIPLTIPGGTLDIELQIDPDQARLTGKVTELDGSGAAVASLDPIELKLNAGKGGLVAGGLRTAFFDTPAELVGQVGDGYLLLKVSKNGRSARITGRLPDGVVFASGVPADGTTFNLGAKLKPNGSLDGSVRVVQIGTATAGVSGVLSWKRTGADPDEAPKDLEMHGAEYPVLGKRDLPPIGLGTGAPNAHLRLSGVDFPSPLDLPITITSAGASGFDTRQLKLKLQPSLGTFSGKFTQPTGRVIPFDGAFRVPFDGEAAQGRGVFRGPSGAGAVRIEAN